MLSKFSQVTQLKSKGNVENDDIDGHGNNDGGGVSDDCDDGDGGHKSQQQLFKNLCGSGKMT